MAARANQKTGLTTRTIQKTLKQRCFSDLLALQGALQNGCTNAVFRSLQHCIFVTALTVRQRHLELQERCRKDAKKQPHEAIRSINSFYAGRCSVSEALQRTVVQKKRNADFNNTIIMRHGKGVDKALQQQSKNHKKDKMQLILYQYPRVHVTKAGDR